MTYWHQPFSYFLYLWIRKQCKGFCERGCHHKRLIRVMSLGAVRESETQRKSTWTYQDVWSSRWRDSKKSPRVILNSCHFEIFGTVLSQRKISLTVFVPKPYTYHYHCWVPLIYSGLRSFCFRPAGHSHWYEEYVYVLSNKSTLIRHFLCKHDGSFHLSYLKILHECINSLHCQ